MTTTNLQVASVLQPENNATGIATNPSFQWLGPTGYPSVFVGAYQPYPSLVYEGHSTLPGDATSWPSPPALLPGTNVFYVFYASYDVTNIIFTTPVDGGLNPIANWSPKADLQMQTVVSFTVGGGSPTVQPAHLTGALAPDGRFLITFLTQADHWQTIQVSTNLVSGDWQDFVEFLGDGTFQAYYLPTGGSAEKYYRVKTQ